MTKEQAQVFVNKLERELMVFVEQSENTDRLDELDEALKDFDSSMMRIMEIISEE